MEGKQKVKSQLLVKGVALCDHEMFFSLFRMNSTKSEELLSLIMKVSEKREPICPSERLFVIMCDYKFAIWLLVKLKVPSHSCHSCHIYKTSVSRIIKETTDDLWKVLSEREFIKVPSSTEKWVEIADHCERKRYVGNCKRAINESTL